MTFRLCLVSVNGCQMNSDVSRYPSQPRPDNAKLAIPSKTELQRKLNDPWVVGRRNGAVTA
jgi:hypothetical protein